MNFTDSLRNDVATRHRINDINCLAHAFNLADEARNTSSRRPRRKRHIWNSIGLWTPTRRG